MLKLRHTIESIINGSPSSSSATTTTSKSPRSAGRRIKGRRRRERLVLPSAIEALASSSLFQEKEHDADATETLVALSDPLESSSQSERLEEDRKAAAVDRCMLHLRVFPGGHRYARGRDVALVVGRDVIHGVADSWERLERVLMSAER